MATLSEIQAQVNARLSNFWPKVQSRQATYLSNHDHYFQGLIFSNVPDDGALVTPDFTVAPADQFDYTPPVMDADGVIVTPEVKTPHSWAWAGVNADLPATVEAQMRIDVWERPAGVHGFALTCRVSKSGITYRRTGIVESGSVVTTGSWSAE